MDYIVFIIYLQVYYCLHHCVSFRFLERILCRLMFNLLLGFHIGLFCAACRVTHALQFSNQVGAQGATALANSLKTNSCLTKLGLVSEGSRGGGGGMFNILDSIVFIIILQQQLFFITLHYERF